MTDQTYLISNGPRLFVHMCVCVFSVPTVDKLRTSGMPQLPADHGSVSAIPEVVTHSSPVVVEAYLHPPLIHHLTAHKPYGAVGASDGWVLVCVFGCKYHDHSSLLPFPSSHTHHTPSPGHTTEASSAWPQLCNATLPLLGQLLSNVSFPVHIMLSRKIGPSPRPKLLASNPTAPVDRQTDDGQVIRWTGGQADR